MAAAASGLGGSGGLSPRQIADRLRQAGEMLRLKRENRYRAGAYEMAADVVEASAETLPTPIAEGRPPVM